MGDDKKTKGWVNDAAGGPIWIAVPPRSHSFYAVGRQGDPKAQYVVWAPWAPCATKPMNAIEVENAIPGPVVEWEEMFPPSAPLATGEGTAVSKEQFTISRDDLEDLVEIRKSYAYLVNETSEGRHHRVWLQDFDRLINRLVGFEVYDVPAVEDDVPAQEASEVSKAGTDS